MKGRAIQYSAAELAFVESHGAMRREALHAAFVARFGRADVTVDHLKSLCSRNGWSTGRQRWRPTDDAVLRELYPDTPTPAIAEHLGRTVARVYARAAKLGLRKSEAFLESEASGRMRDGRAGAAYRFAKGHVPANKGVRRPPGWAPGRMRETQFQQGNVSHTWRPIGSERIIGGYRYTKVSDHRKVVWSVNWKPTQRVRWEAMHGPLPDGMVLKSLDGNRLNTDPSNWVAIPREMLPRLGAKSGRDYDHAPADLKPAIMAIAKLEHAVAATRRADG